MFPLPTLWKTKTLFLEHRVDIIFLIPKNHNKLLDN